MTNGCEGVQGHALRVRAGKNGVVGNHAVHWPLAPRGHAPNCYLQVPKRPYFILVPALVLAIVRYLVMVLVNLSKKNLINAGNLSRKTANIVMSESVQLSR
jgi:hypothetical protein